MTNKSIRHILGLSGGKDSTALAILMKQKYPDLPMEYFFCDTQKELPETYEYLKRIEARLGIKIKYLSTERGFDHWLDVFAGVLPSPKMRWCTEKMKIKPLEDFIGNDEAYSYIGIRADENRDGYISTNPNIKPIFPFKDDGLVKADILQILDESGIGLPDYYRWRTRSGCFFCFFQRKYEWVRLSEEHPEYFAQAVEYERKTTEDRGYTYTWVQGETLLELIERKDQIIADHERSLLKEQKSSIKRSLAEVLESVLDDEDDTLPCLACHL
jgi:3'-phosphoadenosine 5'-phosphosulfate sulfotransferase (PAPS reductase)/FAD synthetase